MRGYWTLDAIDALLCQELGDPGYLDGFRPDPADPSRRRRAAGPPLLLVVHAGNVPGVAVTATVRGLLARSGVLCKVPAAEPGLLTAFARSLAQEDELLARCVAATWWPIDEPAPEWTEWENSAGKVVVYGGRKAVEGIRSRVAGHREIVVYGPGLGVGVVLPPADVSAAAAALARDVCAYEQQGCVSPRMVYVAGAGAACFAQGLAEALDAETKRLGISAPETRDAAAIRSARVAWELEGYEAETERAVLGADDLSWTVLADEEAGAGSEALPRVVYVYRVDDLDELIEILAPLEGCIQSVGYAGEEGLGRLAEAAARLGVSRIAPFGDMAWPPADWRHEGKHQLLPLVNWTDLELPA
jgi:acyl-CoA reductase-like NAD-dependent aldehyde dehydrogenase